MRESVLAGAGVVLEPGDSAPIMGRFRLFRGGRLCYQAKAWVLAYLISKSVKDPIQSECCSPGRVGAGFFERP